METAEEKQVQGRQRVCDSCGVALQEREVFSYKERIFCENCFLGDKGLGPLGDQIIDCPFCGKPLNKFTVVCFHCKSPIRQVGKVEAETKGMGIRVIAFFVIFLIYLVVAVTLGPMSTAAGGSQGRAVLFGLSGTLLALMGIFRVLFGMVFKKVPILNSYLGTVIGVVLFGVGTTLLVLLPFP